MGRAYAAVLMARKIQTVAVGRSKESAARFAVETGIETHAGGVTAWGQQNPSPARAIIAVPVEMLARVALEVIAIGCKEILLEKPGGLTRHELEDLEHAAQAANARIYIAYNRRFLASTLRAKQYIKEDGGAVSFSFEFNERLSQRATLQERGIAEKVVQSWFIANSTHVADLAFYMGGTPHSLKGLIGTGPLWNPHPTLFSGAGITKEKVPFSYWSNWEEAGPWSVEVQTPIRKILLSPLETLRIETAAGQQEVVLDDLLDKNFKPGLYAEVEAFFTSNVDLPTLSEHLENFSWFEKMVDPRD